MILKIIQINFAKKMDRKKNNINNRTDELERGPTSIIYLYINKAIKIINCIYETTYSKYNHPSDTRSIDIEVV